MRDAPTQTLSGAGYQVATAASGRDGLETLAGEAFDLILTDMKMPFTSGIELLEQLRQRGDETPVILITAYGTVDTAVSAMKQGASDYIVKPFQRSSILMAVEKALGNERLRRENEFFRRETGGDHSSRLLVGESPALRRVLGLLEKYAPSSGTVLLRGESGTGKELFSRLLHNTSPRRGKPFLSVNCAALSAGLLESELFGHEKGAFTGADRRNIGRFEIADGGTLLLDEVSEIDTRLQAKLLRVLQEKEFERVGNARTIRVDVRVVATTNRNLEREVAEGRFREDLYFRLSQLVVEIPSLRERREDIPLLARHFLAAAHKRNGGREKKLTEGALRQLTAYAWPGNVRELENLMERAYLLCEDGEVGPDVLGLGAPGHVALGGGNGDRMVGRSVEDVEREHITATLRATDWHQKRAAELLDIGVRTLREKMKKWDLRNAR